MSARRLRIGVVASHPVQYHSPWFRALAQACDLRVLYAHRQTAAQQGQAGYGVAFDWDRDLLEGYEHAFMRNRAKRPGVQHFRGCDTPEIFAEVRRDRRDAWVTMGWYLQSFWQTVAACRLARVPVMARGDSHLGNHPAPWRRAARRAVHPWVLRGFNGFLCPGQRHRAYLRHYGVPDRKIHAVPHPIDDGFFASTARASRGQREALRHDMGVGPHDRLVLSVGRLIDWKRPLDPLHAIAAEPELRARFVVAYAGDGPMRSEIERTAQALGVRMHLLGFQNQTQLPAVYAAADALLVCSTAQESWGLVVNEAMACGTPAIVSDVIGCAPDMIEQGATGFTYPMGDVTALGQALLRLDATMVGQQSVVAALAAKTRQMGVPWAT